MKKIFCSILLILALLFPTAAYAKAKGPGVTPVKKLATESPATITSVWVTDPNPYTEQIKGVLHYTCDTFHAFYTITGNTINITVNAVHPHACAAHNHNFTVDVTVDTTALPSGTYDVYVNGGWHNVLILFVPPQ